MLTQHKLYGMGLWPETQQKNASVSQKYTQTKVSFIPADTYLVIYHKNNR